MISENLKIIKERICRAADKVHRNPCDITFVCVTKSAAITQIEEVLTSGVTDVGESYIKDAEEKFEAIGYKARWHFIGHLQTNKAKKAVRIFDLIHSVDSFKVAEEISKRALAQHTEKKILIEVNTSQEPAKFGVLPEQALPLLEKISGLPGVKVTGLMTMAPFTENPEDSRSYFKGLRKLFLSISDKRIPNIGMEHLSMGMTQDFEVAIEEGATIVRIGRAIFEE